MDQHRQPSGVPTGGQFASRGHAEPTGVSLADDLPGPDAIDDALYREVGKILSDGDGVTTENVIDLMDHDEDQLVAAFGQGPTDWLCSLTVRVEATSRQTYRGGLEEPDEWAYRGYVSVEDGDGTVIAESPWNGEDDPELPRLMRRCPVDASGRPLADVSDPEWARLGSKAGTGRSSEWRRCGFHAPGDALAWRAAGFGPEAASEWAEEGFSPEEAKAFRLDKVGVGTAIAQRRRAAQDEPAHIGEPASVGSPVAVAS